MAASQQLFQKRGFGANGVSQRSLGIPAAAYPGRVATNSDLIVAVDRQQTTLLLPMAVADNTMTVLDASMIVGYNLLSIENEIVKTTGPPGGNVVPIARGFDGTAAAPHSVNTLVSGLVDAWHHNALVAEVEAIETFLGPHGSNLSIVPATATTLGGVKIGTGVTVQTDGTISVTPAFVVSSNYIFPPQSPGGSLIVGNNSINLSPVPAGINGSNTGHRLYISGGSGTAEAALITGGSAVSGAPSGTLIVQCANTHSGAWTIQSATAGIMEAIWTFAGNGGNVLIPPGNWNIYGTMQWTGNNLQLMGLGKSCRIVYQPTSGDIFSFSGSGLGGGAGTGFRNQIRDLFIDVAAIGGTPTGIHINGQVEFLMRDLMINNVGTGIQIDGTTTTSIVLIENCHIEGLTPSTGVGINQTGGADVFIISCVILGVYNNQSQAGVMISYTTGTKIIGCDLFATGYGLMINPGSGQTTEAIDSFANWYDSALTNDAMGIVAAGGTVRQMKSVGDWFCSCGRNGIEFASSAGGTIDGIIIADAQIYNNGQNGIQYNGATNVDFINCQVSGNSGSSPGTYHGLLVEPGAGGFRVIGGIFGQFAGWNNYQGYGIMIPAGASDNYSITGAKFMPNLSGSISNGGTGLNKIVKDNLGISNIIGSLTSAASISLGLGGQEVFYITGTTSINTISGGWTGRSIRLLKQDAGTLTIGTGSGNVGGARTLTAGNSLTMTFDGSFWY